MNLGTPINLTDEQRLGTGASGEIANAGPAVRRAAVAGRHGLGNRQIGRYAAECWASGIEAG